MKTRTFPKGLLPSFVVAGIILTALPASAALKHRYSFNEPPGSTTVVDSIRGSNGVARVRSTTSGSVTFDGSQATLDGTGGYIDLPNRLISTLTNVTFEFWVTWTSGGTWARLLDFGSNSNPEDTDGTFGTGNGQTYVFLAATAGATPRFAISTNSNNAGQETPTLNSSIALTQGDEHHIVVTYGPSSDAIMYIDGVNVASGTYAGRPLSAINDVNNWLGRSNWNDPYFGGSFNEFRIYDTLLSEAEVVANFADGPDDIKVVNLSPTNGTIFASAAGGLSFTTTSSQDIATNNITVVVNGVDVSSALQISGTSKNWQVKYNGLVASQAYQAKITVVNSTGTKVVNTSFDTFNESTTTAIEGENFNYDGGKYINSPTLSTDPLVATTYFQRGSQLGVSNVDFVELNGATRPPTLVGEWRHAAIVDLPQTLENTDANRQGNVSAGVNDYDLVNIVAGEWLNYTHDFSAGNYRVYLRSSATANQSVQLDRVTGNRAQENQTTILLGRFNVARGSYGYAPLVGLDGKEVVLALSGTQTLRLTALTANNNLSINLMRIVPTSDAPSVIGPYAHDLSPAPNSNNARPDLITATITDRETILASGSVQLRVDGNLVTATVTPTATGANVSYTVSPAFVTNTAHTAELRFSDTSGNGFTNQWSFTISSDVQPPLLTLTAGSIAGSQSKLRVYFSERIDPVQAGAVSNYTSSGGVVFSAATVLENNQAVELTASGVAQGTVYTLTVNRVTDAIGNAILANSTIKYNLSPFEQGLDANHLVVIEAESYFANTPSIVPPATALFTYSPVFPTEGFSGGGAMRTLPATGANIGNDPIGSGAAQMDYRVVFNQTGTYAFWSYSSAPGGGNMDSLSIGLDGAYIFSNNGMAAGAPTWRNGVQNGANSIQVDTIGEHTMNIWMRESGNILDKFLLVPTTVVSPVVNASTAVGPAQSRRTGDPFPPAVTLSSPTNGAKLASGAGVVIEATVTDPDSATQLVEFYVDGAKVGEDSTSPYSFTASGVADGYHAVSVKATDPTGLSSFLATAQVQVGNPKPRALFVVSNPAALSASDAAVKARMEGFGFEVVVVAATASRTTDAILKDVVMVSSTVASGDVANKFVGVTVPVVNWEEAIQDDMLFTTAADRGTVTLQTNVNIVLNTHPMAAGLSGVVPVHSTPQSMGWGAAPATATVIATVETDPLQAIIYGFDTGALLIDGATTAAARRVHFFTLDTFASLTPDGVKLFDAALSWAVGRTLVVAPARPTLSFSKTGDQLTLSWPVSAGNFALKTSPVLTTNAGSWSSAGAPTVVGGNNQVTVFTTNNAAFYRLEQ